MKNVKKSGYETFPCRVREVSAACGKRKSGSSEESERVSVSQHKMRTTNAANKAAQAD